MINKELNIKRGQRLKECREERNLTQNELALLSHCTPQSISYIENGRRGMSRDLAHIFAQELHVDEEYILCESNFKTYKDEIRQREKNIDIIDNATYRHLSSLGYMPTFYGTMDGTSVDITNNNSFEISGHDYGNDLFLSISDQKIKVENVKVQLNNIEIALIDYYDLIDDINEYIDFLISKLKDRVERRTRHLSIHYTEEDLKHGKTSESQIKAQLEIIKKDFPEVSKEILSKPTE